MLPKAILFDLDDTILSFGPSREDALFLVAQEFAAQLAPVSASEAADAILAHLDAFWAEPLRDHLWLHDPEDAQRMSVAEILEILSSRGARPSVKTANLLADRFSEFRDDPICLLPGARETIDRLKELGVRLALVTNGEGSVQRAKVVNFGLERRFDHIQIEGEQGFGKPEERAYTHAMRALDVKPHETWMVGDNLMLEVAAPQRLGIYGIWHDTHGRGLPANSSIRPDRIIRALPELLGDWTS